MTTTSTSASLTTQVANPILAATIETFESTLDVTPKRVALGIATPATKLLDVSAVIGLAGEIQGLVCISIGPPTTLKIIEAMVGLQVDQNDPLIPESVSEFVNVIAGSAKQRLRDLSLELGLPSVIQGGDSIGFPKHSCPLLVKMDCELGPFIVAFGFVHAS